MRQVTELKPEWLLEIASHYYQLKDVEGFDLKENVWWQQLSNMPFEVYNVLI